MMIGVDVAPLPNVFTPNMVTVMSEEKRQRDEETSKM